MNKKQVDALLPRAEEIIRNKIASKGKVPKAFRSQISAFGAAISMGSLRSAVAFFSKQGNADVDRSLLMEAINEMFDDPYPSLFQRVCGAKDEQAIKNEIIDRAIALKLAMNLFVLDPDAGSQNDSKAQKQDNEEAAS